MGKGNGKNDGNIDVDRELPAASVDAAGPATSGGEGEMPEEKLKAERDALLDRLARLQAEFDNARKRGVREQQEFREFAAADVIRNFLPILDSFELALQSNADAGEFRNGVELIYRQLQDALLKAGVQPIAALGQTFDPRFHEAIEMVETSGAADQQVVGELQRGYKYKERLLRPAMVRVARNSRG